MSTRKAMTAVTMSAARSKYPLQSRYGIEQGLLLEIII